MDRKLYRSRDHHWLAGMAEYTGIPVVLVRFIWFLLLLPGGVPGVVLYLACWLIIPRAPATQLGD